MSEIALGKIIEGDAKRDAIHIAVAPVIALEKLYPGQPLTLVSGTDKAIGTSGESLGIADPFLRHVINEGDKFWLYLNPNTVTGMRHHWAHPAFSESDNASGQEEEVQRSKKESEDWLRQYAIELNPYSTHDYNTGNEIVDGGDEAFKRLIQGLKEGEITAWGSDLHGFYDLHNADELRKHAENYLGMPIDWSIFSFSCSC